MVNTLWVPSCLCDRELACSKLITHWDNSSKQSFDKITSYIEKAKQAGGEIVTGGGCQSFPFYCEAELMLSS